MMRLRSVDQRIDRVTLAVGVVTLAGLALRIVVLGRMTLHHDESLHAYYAWRFAEGAGYQHDPLMHGPLQFHLIAVCFKVLGDSEWTARLPAALAGTALIATPLLLRRWLGGTGTVIAAVLLCASPTLLYYSRFARNDVPVALWTVLLLAAVLHYREDGRTRWLVVLAAALALQFATKETAYLIAAALLLYLDVALAATLTAGRSWHDDRGDSAPGAGTRARVRTTLLLIPVAWVIAATWRITGRWRARAGLAGDRPREADLLVVAGTLVLPTLGAGVQVLAGTVTPHVAEAIVVGLLVAAAAAGLLWDARRWALLAALFLVITVPLYTTEFTNRDGVAGLFWTSLDYWLDQHAVRRGSQPWFYYGLLVPLYEFATLLPALAGAWIAARRGDAYAQLLLWWAAALFVVLSFAGEKMPWLAVHIALPLALLAAWVLGRWLPHATRRLRAADTPAAARARTACGIGIALLLALLWARTAYGVVFAHPDTPVEPLIYTQSAPDLLDARDAIEAYAASGGTGDAQPIVVDTAYALTWPWAWYLRRYTDVRYEEVATLHAADVPSTAVIVVANSTPLDPALVAGHAQPPRVYHHRWWFPEEGYRSLTAGIVWRAARDGSLVRRVGRFVWRHVPERTLGSVDGTVWFPAPGGGAPMAPAPPRP